MTPDEMFLIIIFGILVFMFIFVATLLPRIMAIRSKGGFKQYPMNENSMIYEGVVRELSEPELPICGIPEMIDGTPLKPGIQYDLRKLRGKYVIVKIKVVPEDEISDRTNQVIKFQSR